MTNQKFIKKGDHIPRPRGGLNLTKEDELIVRCARSGQDAESAHKIEELTRQPLNWEYIVQNGTRHGLAPILYHNLKHLEKSGAVPPETLETLTQSYYNNAARNTALYNDLGNILYALKKAGFESIVLKGAHLAKSMYRNVALRPMCDIDILVKERDLHPVYETIKQLGYTNQEAEKTRRSGIHEQKIKEDALHHYHLQPLIGKFTTVEVHRQLMEENTGFERFTAAAWESAPVWGQTGTSTRVLSLEYLLDYLCLHLAKHSRTLGLRLIWLRDIAETLNRCKDEIDWVEVSKIAGEFGIEEEVDENLYYAWKYLGAPVPESILKEIKVSETDRFASRFGMIRKSRQKGVDYFERLSGVKGVGGKFLHLLFDLFPSREWMAKRYSVKNKNLIYFYYPVRLSIGLYRYARMLIERFFLFR